MPKQYISRRALSRVAAVAATLAISSGAALAGGDYGAIAFSPSTHGHGYAFGRTSREEAEQTAVDECEKRSRSGDCIRAVITEKGCGALAAGPVAPDSSRSVELKNAIASALRNCQSAGSIRWVRH